MVSPRSSEASGPDRVLSYTQDGATLVCVERGVVPVTVIRLSERGQLVIPAEIRSKYELSKGDRFLVRDVGGGILLEPLPRHPLLELKGAFKSGTNVVDLLLAEPRKARLKEGDRDA